MWVRGLGSYAFRDVGFKGGLRGFIWKGGSRAGGFDV